MIRRPPVVATMVVMLAVLLMVRLGLWQLDRRHEKAALHVLYAANLARPAAPLAALRGHLAEALYRTSGAWCADVAGWRTEAGAAADGRAGWRHVARCAGPDGAFLADMGVSPAPTAPDWRGGAVRGRLIAHDDGAPLVARLWRRPPEPDPMIVAATPAAGLAASVPPDPAALPDNHLAYAVQWFVFAALAPVIYLLALRRRARGGGVARREPRR